ncbi:TPA: hypothetical protein ACH3X1_016331 [Trebouxia sp. C0004]
MQRPGPWSDDFCTALARLLWRRSMFTSLKDHKEEYVDGWRSSKDNQAIEPVIMLLWQKLPCVTKKELQLQLVWASHQIVSLTTGWFTARGQCVSYLQVGQLHTVILP